MVRRWPGLSPYSGMFDAIVPHLTVVKTADRELRARVRSAVEGRLPVHARARAASLWGLDRQVWRCLDEFPLAT